MKTQEEMIFEVAQEIRRAMDHQRVSIPELAARMGRSVLSINIILTGRVIRLSTLLDIATALDCELEVNLIKPPYKPVNELNPVAIAHLAAELLRVKNEFAGEPNVIVKFHVFADKLDAWYEDAEQALDHFVSLCKIHPNVCLYIEADIEGEDVHVNCHYHKGAYPI